MGDIDTRIDKWKSKLLDLGKRNRLINYKDTKRSNIKIIEPNISELFEMLVKEEKSLKFSRPLYEEFLNEEDEDKQIRIIEGDLKTNSTIKDQQKTLRNLRNKSKTAKEEQGVNILYISFGFLKWKESQNSEQILVSPIVLVPVALTLESITSPYALSLYEDEVVINPTLAYKLENDFGIVLPEFDSHEDNINEYLSDVNSIVLKNNWKVSFETGLSLLSFLKINMYKDLDKNKERIRSHPIIKALSGDLSEITTLPEEYNNYDHDKNTRPIDTFQVVDADSSQQDAILFSKKGISFVLQGPPGTGKSQTITNIIAEALADGKKVLFVSEKMAALEVVYKRLKQAGLDDFCLNLHSYKANKKEVLQQLAKTLNINKIKLQKDVLYNLEVLNRERAKLNEYDEQLHSICRPLNVSIYDVNGKLAKLQDIPDVVFSIENVKDTSSEKLRKYKYLLEQFSGIIGQMSEDYRTNPWRGCNVSIVTHELRHDIETYLRKLCFQLKDIDADFNCIKKELSINKEASVNGISKLISILDVASKSPKIPIEWILEDDVGILIEKAENYKRLLSEYNNLLVQVLEQYDKDFCNLPASDIKENIISSQVALKQILNLTNFDGEERITRSSHSLYIEVSQMLLKIKSAYDSCQEICDNLDVKVSLTMKNLGQLHNLLDAIVKNPKPTEMWFDLRNDSIMRQLFSDGRNRCKIISEKTAMMLSKYENGILDIDYESMLKRFTVEYTEIYKLINECYTKESLNLKNDDGVITYRIFNEFYDDVIETLKSLLPIITDAYSSGNKLVEMLSLNAIETVNSFIFLNEIVKLILSNPKPTEMWFDSSKTNAILQLISEVKGKYVQMDEEIKTITAKYENEIFNLDYSGMLIRFKTEYTSFLKVFKENYKDDKNTIRALMIIPNKKIDDAEIIDLLSRLKRIDEKKKWLKDNEKLIKSMFGNHYLGRLTDWELLEKDLKNFQKICHYFPHNSIPNKLKQVMLSLLDQYDSIEKNYNVVNKIIEYNVNSKLHKIFSNSIETIEVETLQQNIIKIIQTSDDLKKDFATIKSLNKTENTSLEENQNNIICILNELKNIDVARCWIIENEKSLKTFLGTYYFKEKTNWEDVQKAIDNFMIIRSYFGDNPIPQKIRELLLSGKLEKEYIIKTINSINSITNDDFKIQVNKIFNFDNIETTELGQIIDRFSNSVLLLRLLYKSFDELNQFVNKEISYTNTMNNLNKLIKIQEIKKNVVLNYRTLEVNYDRFFNGIETDWDKVISILGWTNEFKTLCKKYELSNAFIEKVCNCDSSIIYAKDAFKNISGKYQKMKDNLNWFINLFDEKEELLNINLFKLLTRTENCLNNIAQLEEWIDFRSIRKLCNEEGLSDFIDKIQLMKVHNTLIVPIFFKRFYRLWLDSILPDYPAINNFRRRNQEERINNFKKLDLLQLSIARSRIREKLISKLPDVNDVASSFGEVSILKHELNKQRKIMPLRKLFMAIPNLLMSLKPCLMMSPLSVSLFLQGDSYNFDIVIFDEASQVCTEDAIGAIIRGKQVVIAGDSKQLPPTNFFSSTTSDSDFDSFEDEDESYEDIDGYESILDEAVTVLPERSLKWHYRSRHEHLIAFSNAKIYNNNLITFPSSVDKMPDNGVEYVYAENGVYDRGGKKNNIIEAKKVAELVFKHIKNHPNRSLGVVTFSESQQQAVETIIRQMRINNQEYENFFNEEKEEAFFVKNLENVQGDERDTIIFSIGYAKDSNGLMYMNFGPLSKSGGYRRLNVAITRAKYNIKLVGSIRPTDINIDKTNSKGVKMLRSYIEFAINGMKALEQENICPNSVEVESPFEEAVYDFLVEKGFLVSTQVGCSGYRIDIAIRHPQLTGRFVLGIECDGATYHSARTARERDRLRQSILEDMGWKIYRIWSTDWIKDPVTEGAKLVEIVNKAILEYEDDDSDYFNKNNEENVQCNIENEFVEIEEEKDEKEISNEEKNIYGFNWYEEADIYSVNKQGSKSDYLANVIRFVIETEQPIHFEQLCKRVAPLFGNQKATIKVRNSVKNIINLKLKNEVYIKNKFCFLNSDKPINVRIPKSNKNCRQINFISIEELSRAMYVIASKGFGITQNDLFVITARTFGFQRIGDNITQAMKNAFKYLIDTKKVIIINGKVVCDSSYRIKQEKKSI